MKCKIIVINNLTFSSSATPMGYPYAQSQVVHGEFGWDPRSGNAGDQIHQLYPFTAEIFTESSLAPFSKMQKKC